MTTTDPLPPEALTWLAVWPGVRGLTFGGSLLPQRLEEAGHAVFAMADTDRDMRRLLALPGITPFWARPEAIPIDPMAMRGDYGHASLAAVDDSKYFPEVEHRAFRIWQTVSLDDLQQLVANQPLSRRLSELQRKRLADEIRDLFEHAVRPGENLRLPFQLLAWRAWVNHDELTEPVSMPESGIEIDMQVATPLR